MHRFSRTALILVLFLLASHVAHAAPSVGVYFDAAGTQLHGSVTAFAWTFLYIVVRDAGEMDHWQVAMEISAPLITLSETFYPATATRAGSSSGDNYLVNLGACVDTGTGAYALLERKITQTASGSFWNVTACAKVTSPTSFVDTPGYRDCNANLIPLALDVDPWGQLPDGCAIMNCEYCYPPVPVESLSMGAVKARF